MEQTMVTELMNAENMSRINIYKWMEITYGEECLDISTVWYVAATASDYSQLVWQAT